MSFIVVGGLATVIDLVVVYLAYQVLGIHYLVATTLAFVIATVFNYWASMRYTFESKFAPGQKYQEFLLFVILSVAGLVLTVVLMYVAVNYWHLAVLAAKILVTIVVMQFNFVTRKLLLEGINKE